MQESLLRTVPDVSHTRLRAFLKVKRWDIAGTALKLKDKEALKGGFKRLFH